MTPLTIGSRAYPFRIPCTFQGKAGHVVPDQLRTVDRERLITHLRAIAPETLAHTLKVLQAMFAP